MSLYLVVSKEVLTEKKEELLKASGSQSYVDLWDGVFMLESKLTLYQISEKLGFKSDEKGEGQVGIVATINANSITGRAYPSAVEWVEGRQER